MVPAQCINAIFLLVFKKKLFITGVEHVSVNVELAAVCKNILVA
jgi:hypothetical protein